MCHLDLLQRFPLKIIGRKNLIQKSLEAVKAPNKSNENPKTQLSRTERPVGVQESTQEIDKYILFGYEAQQELGDPWVDRNSSKVACRCQ